MRCGTHRGPHGPGGNTHFALLLSLFVRPRRGDSHESWTFQGPRLFDRRVYNRDEEV